MTERDERALDSIIESYGKSEESLIPIMHEIQKKYNYLPEEALLFLSKRLDLPVSKIFTVVTFYKAFSLNPVGRNKISVCMGTACYVKTSENLHSRINSELGLSTEEGTTEDMEFTVNKVRCLGCCSLAPVVRINEDTYGNMTQEQILEILEKYRDNKHTMGQDK